MKNFLATIALAMMATGLAAATIDGKWRAEIQMPQGKAAQSGRTLVATFDLKSDGEKLAGTVTSSRGKRGRTIDIKDGKIDGDHFTFSTVRQGPNGERTLLWEGTVSGEALKGSTGRGKRSIPFTAKRL